jgi:membrane complex biogenesis BtpA family protein
MINLKNGRKTIIGMVHTSASPGTPNYSGNPAAIIEKAVAEAKQYEEAGFNAILIENMHDIPYLNREVGPEVVAILSAVATNIKQHVKVPVGIQVLAGANKAALAIALASGLDFIRAEGFVFGHMADEGWMNSDAGELLRYRKQIGADHIQVFTDIMKKHSSHQMTADLQLTDWIEAASFFKSDGIIITGSSTGKEADHAQVEQANKTTQLPILIGSGINASNIENYWPFADAFIIGSSIKEDGIWYNAICPKRLNELTQKVAHLNNL